MLFGGIETGEGMTTTLFWHLLTNPDQLAALRRIGRSARRPSRSSGSNRPRRGGPLRDRDVELAGASIRRGTWSSSR